ncbi:hypothetical protein [Deinococcus multiflagellatus]|uniref:Uncharacterized protein n=1 Tax=Deinococcus multiflagellatus TaxID=1656887 RepID=A0ABW1ZII6_9DEIO|nr:hypothetical protein [Deinococcus multiflagellatus]MBZ9712201.1 hypothetical protein [Deinococcus multiflagellatus]
MSDGSEPPIQAAHREFHKDRNFATIKVGQGWEVVPGSIVVWSWKDPAEEVWEVVEVLSRAEPHHVMGHKVLARRLS